MQRSPDGTWLYSPRDLIAWLEGDFAAWCDREFAEHHAAGEPGPPPHEPDAQSDELKLAAHYGIKHEKAHLERLKAEHPDLVEIDTDQRGATAATLTALRAGASVVFQAKLRSNGWMGIADFIQRIDGTSSLGDWQYEPWDTKLARSAKPYFLLQLCVYAELLSAVQNKLPERLGFILGDGQESGFKTADFWHYYRRLKHQFERFQADWDPGATPDPGADRGHGRWSKAAEEFLAGRDDLSLVAGISRSQVIRLRDAGITTVQQLGAMPANPSIHGLATASLAKIREQAAMQLKSRDSEEIAWTFRAPDPDNPRRGLALLPPPSRLDIFYDIEGFPYAPGGLEYLQGATTIDDDGTLAFHDWWAHDEAAEKRAFEEFVDWAWDRWQRDPAMHIYHYAGYEHTALARLSTKYATREYEIDEFLRNDVLVDLLAVVRQGMVIGTSSYSLKDIEKLYMDARVEAVSSAMGSVVAYQAWLDSGEPGDWNVSGLLKEIRDYNQVDCDSTAYLRRWLLERQREAGVGHIRREDIPEVAAQREKSAAELLAEELTQRAEQMPAGERRRVTQLLAWLLEYHRRDDKPMWWRKFNRLKKDESELYDDPDCLAGVHRTDSAPWPDKRSLVYEYAFDADQETRLHDGSAVFVASGDTMKCEIESFDPLAGLLTMKVGKSRELPHRCNLLPNEYVSSAPMVAAIEQYVREWSEGRTPSSAVDDLIHRRAPRLTGHSGGDVIPRSGDLVAETIAAIRAMDRTTLAIQGPPGTGKTHTAACVIAALLADGKKVGVVANSHAVVENLLARIGEVSPGSSQSRLWKVGGGSDHPAINAGTIKHLRESKQAAGVIDDDPIAIGGTAWLFSRPELVDTLDYLFVDEAGQVSLANAVAVGQSARNLVLIGDQMQLAQPTQGEHPGESGLSCLEYLLQGRQTIPAELGILLDTSYRLPPDLCRFISDAYYDGRLASEPRTHGNRIDWRGSPSGVVYIPIEHEGRAQSSEEECEAIAELTDRLIGASAVIVGERRTLGWGDILIVAPFNAQVRALKLRLGDSARIGTVDKFQGQEAPVVIVSMSASTLDDAPRGAGFLLSPNRLNVAISRAQALALVVGSSRLGDVRVRSVDEMRLVNGWCRVEERVVAG